MGSPIVVQRKDEKGLYQRSISTIAKQIGIPVKLITSFPTWRLERQHKQNAHMEKLALESTPRRKARQGDQ